MFKIVGYIFIFPIKAYQKVISPFFSNTCRFDPTCSEYAIKAIRSRGSLIGLWLSIKRISKCHPWGGSGYDPVPESGNCCLKSKK